MRAKPAVFLDRDGVIVKEVGPITSCGQVELYPGAAEAIAALNQEGWLTIVITNQSAVARGLLSETELQGIHDFLCQMLAARGARLDGLFYCPHLPPEEDGREEPPYLVSCSCRKPAPGLIEKAAREFKIDWTRSYMVGDRECDILAGANAGLATVLVRTGYGVQHYKGTAGGEPDFIFDDLAEAVRFLLMTPREFRELEEAILVRYLGSGTRRIFILVGGQARAGKSTLVNYLVKCLKGRGIPAAVVCLDHWILPLNKRQERMSVLDRYPEEAIERDFSALFAGGSVVVEAYDAASRGMNRKPKRISLPPAGVVFIEGVVALNMKFLQSISDFSVFLKINEAQRRQRFWRYYQEKGLPVPEIEALYATRLKDEWPIVEEGQKIADIVLEFSGG
ncbi:HAD-IIIA family hydrolase [Thermodesulfitimonas autotrophica]|uniref:HAD-IIIA family hydrolase n=1 Tax=Thermodesulfitimonas autotrophica TaxID=1894989 RepID=UPI002FDFFBA2